jgi:Fur family ferric uptake transcriptional regulator
VTHSHDVPPLPAPDVPAAVTALRARGLRMSAARRLVLEVLYAAGGPVTAEEVAAGLGGRMTASDLGSVYRNLDTLERAGLVVHAHAGHGPAEYRLRNPGTPGVACCEVCGRSQPIAAPALAHLQAVLRDRLGWEASFSHFPLLGRCPDCAGAGAPLRRG